MRFTYLASSLVAVSALCFVGCSSNDGGQSGGSQSQSDMSSPSGGSSSSSQDTSNSSQSASRQRAYNSHDSGTYHPMTDNTGKYPQAPQENVRTSPDNQQGQ